MGLFAGLLQGLGGIIGLGIGANSNAKAISKEGKLQQQGIEDAIGEQRREYDTARTDFQPFMQLGYGALGPLGDLLGLNGNDKAKAAIDNLKQSSLYQSLFGNGLEANLQNASATGGIRGGNEVTSLDDFGRDTLAQVIQQKIANLFGATNVGQGATGSVTQVGENTSDNISNGMIGIGNSKAGVVAGQQNVWNGFANSIQKLLSSIPTGGF